MAITRLEAKWLAVLVEQMQQQLSVIIWSVLWNTPYNGNAMAGQNLKNFTLRPNTKEEFETTCPAVLTYLDDGTVEKVNFYPNPASELL